ncbi:MAG: CoA pyrophosphatase [Bacteroidetes bacterium]|nr:CoA pyrophosphatase [Bacteroidota bacterium]
MEILLNKLKQLNFKSFPGEVAHLKMAPFARPAFDLILKEAHNYKPSAVAVVICFDENNKPYIPLIKRPVYNGAHSGQISFPGGKFELKDGNLFNTCLRECFEEIGLSNIELLTELSATYIPASKFMVKPFLFYCTQKNPLFNIQEHEVESLVRLYIDTLLNDNIIEKGVVEIREKIKIKAPYFSLNEMKIWGATAMILSELKEIMKNTIS